MLCEGRFVCRDDDMDEAKVSNATYIASLKLNERCCVNSDRREYIYIRGQVPIGRFQTASRSNILPTAGTDLGGRIRSQNLRRNPGPKAIG